MEYWCEETMFAPCSNRKPETAATIPGRSAQPISRRAVYGLLRGSGNRSRPRGAARGVSS